jgi:hypothetical protein
LKTIIQKIKQTEMKKIMMILAVAGLSYTANAQEATPDPNAPDIKWESTTIDYGSVKKGDESVATKTFKFTNTGKTPLILSSCRGSCGCTVPTCPTEPILPGKGGTISVHYDVNRIGPFTKTVSVSSNTKTPNETLKITGNVLDEASAPAEAPASAPVQQVKPATGTASPAQPSKTAPKRTTPAKATSATPTKGDSGVAKSNAKGQTK